MCPALPDRNGANGDAEIEVAGEIEIANRACVDLSARRLELRQDLHRADLGRARHRPGRKACHQRIEVIAVLGQAAVDGRDEVHHVGITFKRHVLRYADRSVLADPSEIVAAQVDEHDVLGALFLVALQLLGKPEILLIVGASRTRASNRVRLSAPALDPDEHLRRRPDDGELPHPDEVHVGRGIHVAERPVDREGIGGNVGLEALREDPPIDVTGGNPLLNRPHTGFEDFLRLVRADFRRRPPVGLDLRESSFELAFEKLDSWRRRIGTEHSGPHRP